MSSRKSLSDRNHAGVVREYFESLDDAARYVSRRGGRAFVTRMPHATDKPKKLRRWWRLMSGKEREAKERRP